MGRFTAFVGIFVFLGIAYLLSNNRKAISKRVVFWGMGLQFIFAILVLGVPALNIPGPLSGLFILANDGFAKVISFTNEGSNFIFGFLNKPESGDKFIFAVSVLPTIIFFSSLMAVGYYLGVMQKLVKGMAYIMQRTMGTSGGETLSMAANIFVGQTEAPLLVKPYVNKMTQSELMTVMTGGFATVAGGVLAAYVMMLRDAIPDIAGHLMTASVLSAPAALVMAKIMIPETGTPLTQGTTQLEEDEVQDVNVIEAAARGAGEGLKLALNVGAMLLAFIALIAMFDFLLAYVYGLFIHIIAFIPDKIGLDSLAETIRSALALQEYLKIKVILGYVFSPVAFFMGIPLAECTQIGSLIGEKMALNEFVAYLSLSSMQEQVSERSMIIASYALCGFANFSSIAIQIGGIGGIAPSRRSDLAKIGLRAMLAGTIAACLTGCWASILI